MIYFSWTVFFFSVFFLPILNGDGELNGATNNPPGIQLILNNNKWEILVHFAHDIKNDLHAFSVTFVKVGQNKSRQTDTLVCFMYVSFKKDALCKACLLHGKYPLVN